MWVIGGVVFLAVWFLYFAGGGLRAGFGVDDLANLSVHLRHSLPRQLLDNLLYVSATFRPLGGLVYTILYDCFGFHPLPFRLFSFALLGINLALLYEVCRRLSGSREIGFLAAFLASFHAWFVDLYYSTGTIYDLLCFTFYFSALLLYVRIRQAGRLASWRETFEVAALYVCALNAKEMAVTLPLAVLIYELVYHLRREQLASLPRWFWREGRTALVLGLATVPYVIGKLTGPDNLLENPAYRVTISPHRYLHAFFLYLNPLLYQNHVFHDSNTVQLLLAMLALGIWLRSRPLLFAWCFVLVSLLPVAFMAHYSAFFLYLPMAGWALYAAVTLSMLRQALLRVSPPRREAVAASQIALTAALALFLAPKHARELRQTLQNFSDFQGPVQLTADQLLALQPQLTKGARLLFVDDPFPADSYTLQILPTLLYHDMSIRVERTRTSPALPSERGAYDAVFQFREGGLVKE